MEQREALQQLQQYLSDNIAPMIFAESLDSLFSLDPQLIASQIIAWVASLHNTSGDLATADYIFHAAKKLHLLGELELIPLEQAAGCVEALRPHLLQACPEPDRAGLANDFDNIVAVKLEGPRSWEKILEMRELAPDVCLLGGMAAVNLCQELQVGVAGNVPDACLTDLLVQVYEHFIAGHTAQAQETFKRYKAWLDFLHLHRLSNYEVEKETLRQRGVIRSSYTRLPHGPLLTPQAKEELHGILDALGLLP